MKVRCDHWNKRCPEKSCEHRTYHEPDEWSPGRSCFTEDQECWEALRNKLRHARVRCVPKEAKP